MKLISTNSQLPPTPRKLPSPPLAPRSPEEPDRIATILLVHGTYANNRDRGSDDWWRVGSHFCQDLDQQLKSRGEPARCWAHLDLSARSPTANEAWGRMPFAWTGENSERSRRIAGRALAAQLSALESDAAISHYHLLAHSHGGNVILNAIDELPRRPEKLRKVIFMGTPVLYFRHWESFDKRWVSIPVYAAIIWGCAWAYRFWPGYEWIALIVAAIVFFTMTGELIRMRTRITRRSPQYYGSGQPSAFVFERPIPTLEQHARARGEPTPTVQVLDEAIAALLSAQQIVRHPGRFLEQFLKPGKITQHAVPVTEPPLVEFKNQIKETVAHSWLTSLMNSKPETPQLFPQQAGVLKTLKDTLFNALPLQSIAIPVLWVCAVLPFLILRLAMTLCSLTAHFTGGILARAFVRSTYRLGRISLPFLLRRAVFGADSGTFQRITDLPPGVERLEPLNDDVLEQATQLGLRLGDHTESTLLQILSSTDVFGVKAQVTQAFVNQSLAHSYYYKSPTIRQRIVDLICQSCPALEIPPMLSFSSEMELTKATRPFAVSHVAAGKSIVRPLAG